jgi:hypothetical protein
LGDDNGDFVDGKSSSESNSTVLVVEKEGCRFIFKSKSRNCLISFLACMDVTFFCKKPASWLEEEDTANFNFLLFFFSLWSWLEYGCTLFVLNRFNEAANMLFTKKKKMERTERKTQDNAL